MMCNFVRADNKSFIIIDQIKYSRYLISSYQFIENFGKKKVIYYFLESIWYR